MLEQPQTPRSRRPLAVVALVAIVLGGGLAWYLSRATEDGRTRPAPSTPPASARDEPAPKAAPTPATKPPPAGDEARKLPAPAAAPPAPELRVDSDVAGAMVFLNRKFVGKTPLVTRNVTPGTHQLNVVAEGYDAVVRTVEIGEETTSVDVELKKVTLDEAVDVVHKHGLGSCEGRLAASLEGLRYAPTEGDHAFSLSWGQVGAFRMDYLEKTLRVQQQGGDAWNFTTRAENADPLFVFHRDVEKAREQLSGN
ncbi:MAG: PEGA domain-containing protein [Vicinamibacteraceae bacterium]